MEQAGRASDPHAASAPPGSAPFAALCQNRGPKQRRWAALLLFACDIACILLVYLMFRVGEIEATLFFQLPSGAEDDVVHTPIDLFLVLGLVGLLRFLVRGSYVQRRLFWDEARDSTRLICFLGLFDIAVLLTIDHPSGLGPPLLSWLALIVGLPLTRYGCKLLLDRAGIWRVPAVIVGTGPNAQQTFRLTRQEWLLGLDPQYFIRLAFAKNPAASTATPTSPAATIPVIEMRTSDLSALHRRDGPHVIIATEVEETELAREVIDRLAVSPNALDVVPSLRGLPLYGLDITHVFGHELMLLHARNNLARHGPRIVKRSIDILFASFLLAAFAPFFLAMILLIRRDGGPAIFLHDRVGRNGRTFRCLKFRTMVIDAEARLAEILTTSPKARAEWERTRKLRHDPRVTAIGRFLRKTSLDELPQVINVLLGHMSLVGPRPVMRDELDRYGIYARYYQQVRPGITGLWQVSGRSDMTYDDRSKLDTWYIKNWSLWYDIVILFRTVPVVLGQRGAY